MPRLPRYLFGVHGGGANGVNDHHVGPGVGVHQVTAVALPQGVHHARLVEILQRGQVLHAVEGGRVCLELGSQERSLTHTHTRARIQTHTHTSASSVIDEAPELI